MTYTIIFLSLASMLIIPVIYIIRSRDSIMEIEKNRKVIYNEICGGDFDSDGVLDFFNNNLLTSRLTLYDGFLVISSRKKIVLQYGNIVNLKIAGTIPLDPHKPQSSWRRLVIEHNLPDVSKRIFLYLSDCEKVKKIIEEQISSTA